MPKDVDINRPKHSVGKSRRKPPKQRDKEADSSDDDGPWGWKDVRKAQTKGHKDASNAADYVRDISASVKSLLSDLQQHIHSCNCDCECSSDLLRILQTHQKSLEGNVEKAQASLVEVLTEFEMATFLLNIVKSNR
ncbi:hypothetical protein CC1G_15626 [Coprinopsis cinerea okayama7|uniref:Uncharacterized protein n=1 Tax=Coprinopsis cinerea (strain Okayama-7 / 130 / ATCC MYA-4618 / FGSC 9003) TaxID=240176 RepID=D6RNF6_COPC7|nr:hypothetical protein CC1G_15626 [Coprinopsis cinerea okayama7\|eukprot:XP_002911084.1 hypothetical protein CC1G_15626 [Coprinopsis cinerea okayama7\